MSGKLIRALANSASPFIFQPVQLIGSPGVLSDSDVLRVTFADILLADPTVTYSTTAGGPTRTSKLNSATGVNGTFDLTTHQCGGTVSTYIQTGLSPINLFLTLTGHPNETVTTFAARIVFGFGGPFALVQLFATPANPLNSAKFFEKFIPYCDFKDSVPIDNALVAPGYPVGSIQFNAGYSGTVTITHAPCP